MAEINYIKDLYEIEGKSLREIARMTGKDFRTVQKYAYRDDWNPPVKPNMNPKRFRVLGKYIPTINEWLEQDELEPRKQRHTISKVYNRLQEEHGYKGCYGSVKRYVNRKWMELQKNRESFLPLASPLGNAQTDFGEFKYYDGFGEAKVGHALVVSFPNANAGWLQVYPSENQECLLTGLKTVFNHIGGVPVRLRCDNMTTAVVKILEGTERIITDGFHRFMLHHRFQADFCNPDKGNEKGNVENKVGYTRRNMLVPVPVITDFEMFNKQLLRLCDENHNREHYSKGELICELWEEERKHLLTLPNYDYEIFRYESLNVNRSGFIKIDTNKYGLSPEMRGEIVQVKIYFDKIEVFHDHCLLKVFQRSYGKNNEDSDWKDYLPSLVKKPGATEHTRFFNQMPKLWQDYLKSVHGKERKSALLLLSEIVNDGNADLSDDAIELAKFSGRVDNDNIRQCYLCIAQKEYHPEPLKLAADTPQLNYHPDLSAYDGLLAGTPISGGVAQ